MAGNCVAKVAVSTATYWVDRPYDYHIPPELAERAVPGVRVTVPFAKGNRRTEGIVLATAESSTFDKLKNLDSVLDSSPVLTAEQIRLALWMRERFFCTVYDAVKAMLPAGLWFHISSVYRICPGYDRARAFDAAGRSKREAEILDLLFANGGVCDVRDIERVFADTSPSAALRSLVKKGVLETDGRETRRIQDKSIRMVRLDVPAEEAMAVAAQKRRSAPMQASVLELLAAIGKAAVSEVGYFTGASNVTIKALEKHGLVALEAQEVFRRPKYRETPPAPLPVLNTHQASAFTNILDLADGQAKAALLFGVTGSGKTTIYIRLIDALLKRGKGAILLVPEISLTPQMLATFSSHFGEKIAVLHSSLAIGERYDEWKRVRSGAAKVVIGTRSAVFAPVQDLGIIIIDEEQEGTYKSENAPRYHARDVAKYRCAQAGALLLLGSATPDVATRHCAEIGRYHYFALPERYNRTELPSVEIVDMKRELRRGNPGNISSVLRHELEINLARGEQSILFLNRRGTSKLITCGECGYTYQCPKCSVSLTYHSATKRLMCHYCGHVQHVDDACPECGGKLSFIGAGTQKVEEELAELFPGIPVLRMDTDTVTPAGSHEALLERFQEKNIPIMIGTQMVTKGLNFENVTLVGVISADQSLYVSDYRSGERTFSLITQVVGRAGRGTQAGRAVIQTFTPENQIILQAARQDYESFYRAEIELRRMQNSPPFVELYALTASGPDETAVLRCCSDIRAILSRQLSGQLDKTILGPAPLPVVKVNGRFRYRVTLSCQGNRAIRELVSNIVIYCNTRKAYKGISVYADNDPAE